MNEKPTHLDLFSGIGGFALAAGWAGFETVGFCDNEPYAQAVLKEHWPNIPIHGDIKALDGTAYSGVTLLTGGFPCQPFSCAGKQRGKDDDRYLWPEMLRVIQESRPTWIVGENVAGIIGLALDQVCSDLEACGYGVEPIIVPACAVNAPHRRNRVWILAHAKGGERGGLQNQISTKGTQSGNQLSGNKSGLFGKLCSENVANAICKRSQGAEFKSTSSQNSRASRSASQRPCSKWAMWLPEPNLGRVAHGIPNRVAKLRGLGNAIVPQVAYEIIKGIRKLL